MRRPSLTALRDRLPSGPGGIRAPRFVSDAWFEISQGPFRWVAAALAILIVALPIALTAGGSDAPAVKQAGSDPVSKEVLQNAEAAQQAIGAPSQVPGGPRGKGLDGKPSNPFATGGGATGSPATGGGGAAPAAGGPTGASETPSAPSGGGSSGPSDSSTPLIPSRPAPSGGGSGGDSTSGSRSGSSTSPRWYVLAARVRLAAGDRVVRKAAKPSALLPSAEAPILVYVGASTDRRYATFMPAPGTVVDSGARCRPTPEQCWFIRVRVGRTVRLRVLAGTAAETPVKLRVREIERRRVSADSGSRVTHSRR